MENLPRRRVEFVGVALTAMVLWSAPASAQRAAPTYPQVKAASVVPEYAAVLRALDPAQPASILKARDAALSTYAKAASDDAEAAFRQFRAFYEQALRKQPYVRVGSPLNTLLTAVCEGRLHVCDAAAADAFLTSTRAEDVELRNASDAGAVADLARYRAHGIWFLWGEGDWYAAPDPSFVLSVANKLPLGELGAWVTFWAAEQHQRVAEDASLLIGWDDLRKRLARWETFALLHPGLPETRSEVEPHVRQLVAIYVFGIPNTPAYDDPTGLSESASSRPIDPKLHASYGRFLAENTKSTYFALIDGIVKRLAVSGGIPSKALVAFLKAELTDPYFKHWLQATDRWFGK